MTRTPTSGAVRVFFTRITPPRTSATGATEPIVVVGTELGSLPNYSGIAPLAQRTGREVVVVDTRGTGHSQPALECPEVEQLAVGALAAPASDEHEQQAFLTAVGACHDRLAAGGINLAAFTVAEMAADLDDLRGALGIPAWTLLTYGTSSRIALEAVRRRRNTSARCSSTHRRCRAPTPGRSPCSPGSRSCGSSRPAGKALGVRRNTRRRSNSGTARSSGWPGIT